MKFLQQTFQWTLLTAALLPGCKSALESSGLKDDIYVKQGDDQAMLYWLATDRDGQHVCRAVCPEDKIIVKGDLQETRTSCRVDTMQSVNAEQFKAVPELQGLFGVFTQELTTQKVAVLSTEVTNASVKQQNEARIKALANLFTDEIMYLDANIRSLREQGLVGFGEENSRRHHPSCLNTQASSSASIATNVGENNESDATIINQLPIKPDQARMLYLPRSAYETLYTFLEASASGRRQPEPYSIHATRSLGNEYLWINKGQEKFKLGFANDRGVVWVKDDGSADQTLHLKNAEAHGTWNQFARALFEVRSHHVGTSLRVAKGDVQIPSYIVTVSQAQNASFSSPGEVKSNTMRITPFLNEKQNKYALQFELFVPQAPATNPEKKD